MMDALIVLTVICIVALLAMPPPKIRRKHKCAEKGFHGKAPEGTSNADHASRARTCADAPKGADIGSDKA